MEYYFYFWFINILVSIFLLIKYRENIILLQKKYLLFILIKWKLFTSIIATIGIILIGFLSGDPTWDIGISLGISFLYIYTSPYVIGVFYRYFKKLSINIIELYISIIIFLFSSSWFYDGYNYLFLLGHYPETWTSNFIFSFPIYILAGMFWSLDYKKGIGVMFSFTEEQWVNYKSPKGSLGKIYKYILLISLLITYIFLYFLYYFTKN